MQIIREISLPKQQDAEAFATFMREAYFPTIPKTPTRVGQVVALALLQGESTVRRHKFLWLTGWAGVTPINLPVSRDKKVQRKFDNFGATLKFLGFFDEVADWREDATA